MSLTAGPSVESFRPAPERLWIRYRPRNWPAAESGWVDWSHATLGHGGRAGTSVAAPGERHLSDVVYLPPVSAGFEGARAAAAEAWASAGTPVLLQCRVGLDTPPGEGRGTTIWDALPALVAGDTSLFSALAPGSIVVWPLIGGVSDLPEVVAGGLEALDRARAAVVQPLELELSAVARRQLAAQGDETTFDRLFHGPKPSAREFSRHVVERGLNPFMERPVPSGPARLALRRRCSGQLRLAAYLQHSLGRPDVESQRLLRAARWIDRENHDLAGLVQGGNLGLIDWLEGDSAALVEDVVTGGRPRLVDRLLDEYVGGV